MNLHYSQTYLHMLQRDNEFYHPMNLHYSQTLHNRQFHVVSVLPSYEFTLLSNTAPGTMTGRRVLPSYEFTLLSNQVTDAVYNRNVLPSYEFTLLSNLKLVCSSATLPRR